MADKISTRDSLLATKIYDRYAQRFTKSDTNLTGFPFELLCHDLQLFETPQYVQGKSLCMVAPFCRCKSISVRGERHDQHYAIRRHHMHNSYLYPWHRSSINIQNTIREELKINMNSTLTSSPSVQEDSEIIHDLIALQTWY